MRFLVGTTTATHDQLEREAERAGVSVSLYVCALIETHLELLARLRADERASETDDDIAR